MNFHQTANAFEAAFWAIIGLVFLWRAFRFKETSAQNRCRVAAAAFLVFGLSDVIEITTGAWWRPWWLFLMKAICVVTLLGLYIEHRSRSKKAPSPTR